MNVGSPAHIRPWLHLTTALALAALGTAVGVGIGCSSGGGGGGGGVVAGPPIALGNYCDSKANVYCGEIVPCCAQAGYPSDKSKCHDAVVASCQSEITTNQTSGRTYNAQAAGTCLANVSSLLSGCKEAPTTPSTSAIEQACSGIWGGSVPLGGACTSSSDCAAAADGSRVTCNYTASSDGGPSGKCTAVVVAKVGQTCGSIPSDAGTSYVSCDVGLSCQYTPGDGGVGTSTCVQLGDVGAACTSPSGCKTGLTCDATAKKCAQPPAIGSACQPYGSSSCATGAYCDATTSKCVALPGAGQPCAKNSYPQCASDAQCDSTSQTCIAKLANGAACSSSSQCASGYCGATATSSAKTCGPDPGIATQQTCAIANGGPVPN